MQHCNTFFCRHEDGTIKFWDIRESEFIVILALSFLIYHHFSSPAVSMHLLYVLKCSQFFNTLDSDFFPADSPDNDDDEEEEGEESGGRAKKHKIKHVSSRSNILC